MRGSIVILALFIMVAMSIVLITAFTIAESHLIITRNNNLHQEAYYLAESGMGFAQHKLHNIIMQIHEECLAEFQWDPLKYPTYSLQESAREYIENNLGIKTNKMLQEMELYNNFPVPEIPGFHPDSNMDIQIKFTDIYTNPSRLLISSRAEIGNIRRRIDAEININKISNIYDSYLFNKVLIAGGDICISDGGRLESFGSLHIQGGLHVLNRGILNIHKFVSVKEEINVSDYSQVLFNDDVMCYGLQVKGLDSSSVQCSKDLYSYSILSASGPGNTIYINGKLYIIPEDDNLSAGVSATNEAFIYLKDEIFINGSLQYETDAQYLFGIEHIPIEYGIYHSSESIGGGNHSFYFPNYIPEYAQEYFIPGFNNLNLQEQGELIFTYLNTPPDSERELSKYLQHLNEIDTGNIQLNINSGFTSGMIFANNQILQPFQMSESEAFFEDILREMKLQTAWDYNKQINTNVSVPLNNVTVEGKNISVIDPEKPLVCIIPENKELILPSGEYCGIIMTNGPIYIPPDADVAFKGLLITGENVMVEGKLFLYEDKNLLLDLLRDNDNALSKFFKIEKEEKPLFEIISCKEVLYSTQW